MLCCERPVKAREQGKYNFFLFIVFFFSALSVLEKNPFMHQLVRTSWRLRWSALFIMGNNWIDTWLTNLPLWSIHNSSKKVLHCDQSTPSFCEPLLPPSISVSLPLSKVPQKMPDHMVEPDLHAPLDCCEMLLSPWAYQLVKILFKIGQYNTSHWGHQWPLSHRNQCCTHSLKWILLPAKYRRYHPLKQLDRNQQPCRLTEVKRVLGGVNGETSFDFDVPAELLMPEGKD